MRYPIINTDPDRGIGFTNDPAETDKWCLWLPLATRTLYLFPWRVTIAPANRLSKVRVKVPGQRVWVYYPAANTTVKALESALYAARIEAHFNGD